MQYTFVSPDGETWLSDDHRTMDAAYRQALAMYGQGVLIRETWYGEWDCGMYQEGDRCGFDKYGNHIRAEEIKKIGGEGPADLPPNSDAVILPTINTMRKAAERLNTDV